MNESRQSFAVQPPSGAIATSDRLAERLAAGGDIDSVPIYESIALMRTLALSGRRAHDEREAILRVRDNTPLKLNLRRQLDIHLQYWRSVNQIRTGRPMNVVLEQYELEVLPTTSVEEFQRRATSDTGIDGYEVRGLDISVDALTSFAARNCRIVQTTLNAQRATSVMLGRSSLVGTSLHVEAGEFDAGDAAIWKGEITCEAPRVLFSASVMRGTRLTIRSPAANLSNADLARNLDRPQPELVQLARSFGLGKGAKKVAVEFIDCSFPDASFDQSLLQGSRFRGCTMPRATFVAANLDDVAFENCPNLDGVDFSKATSLKNTTIDGRPVVP